MTPRRRTCRERGATAIEYGLIAALMAIVMLVGLTNLADNTTGLWGGSTNKILNAMNSAR